jgi:hypothetical protein
VCQEKLVKTSWTRQTAKRIYAANGRYAEHYPVDSPLRVHKGFGLISAAIAGAGFGYLAVNLASGQ